MSLKPKFSKLRLPGSKRTNSATCSSQISKFFSQPHHSDASTENGASRDPDDDSNSNLSVDPVEGESISMPNPIASTSTCNQSTSTVKQIFASYEANKPKKIRRIDTEKSTNHSTIKEFFATQSNESDFETPRKPVKTVPTTKNKKQRNQANGAKKQTKIKNVLLRKEQMLSSFIAEQSIAENVDPNEMQMALALSRSELETCKADIGDEASNGSSNSMDGIREKLEEFGYRVGRTYGGSNLAPKARGKWANKFTSLTLRNAEHQQEKVYKKIQEFLNTQYTANTKDFSKIDNGQYAITSSFLSKMKPKQLKTFHLVDEPGCTDLANFYVTDICKPTTSKVGNLLKDFRKIPGRDVSPERVPAKLLGIKESIINECKDEVALDESKENRENINEKNPVIKATEISVAGISQSNEDQNFVRAVSPDLFMDEEEDDFVETPEHATEKTGKPIDEIEYHHETVNFQLYAEENANPPLCSVIESKDSCVEVVTISSGSNSRDIITCEQFSSDEVKTVDRSGIWNQDLNYTLQNIKENIEPKDINDLIDLTQENIVDLTQGDVENNYADELGENNEHAVNDLGLFHHSQEEDNERLSQNSSASVIVLSDDEVNYSIKIAKGLDLSFKHEYLGSEKEDNGFEAHVLAKTKESQREKLAGFNDFDYSFHEHDKNENQLSQPNDSNNSTPTKVFEDRLNCSLAHEIMSHSFQEEFDRYYPLDACHDKQTLLPDNNTGEVLCLDLTEPSPPDKPDEIIPSYSTEYVPSVCPEPHATNLNLSKKIERTHSDSLLIPKASTSKSLKRFSSSRKFDEFIDGGNNDNNDEIDEFDQLVYAGSQVNRLLKPAGIKKLLNNEIKSLNDSIEEITIDGRVYSVKTQNIKPKPNYERMDSPTRLKELYKYGLKPLKRKQALIMLEYIYNQTHPFLVENNPDDEVDNGDPVPGTENAYDVENQMEFESQATSTKLNKYDLKDNGGENLVVDDGLRPEIDDEDYIFQTNTRSKVSTALVPLHIAWFNLVKSNEKLREAILCYEPIDLQEIYIFFKRIGYRYDPKDLKRFFDGRSIIFQYDLSKEGTNRHVRKPRKQVGKTKS